MLLTVLLEYFDYIFTIAIINQSVMMHLMFCRIYEFCDYQFVLLFLASVHTAPVVKDHLPVEDVSP